MPMPTILLRLKQVLIRLACGKTKFDEDYRFHSADDPFVPNTEIPRLKPIALGERNIAFLESELDDLIDALARRRSAEPSQPASKPPEQARSAHADRSARGGA